MRDFAFSILEIFTFSFTCIVANKKYSIISTFFPLYMCTFSSRFHVKFIIFIEQFNPSVSGVVSFLLVVQWVSFDSVMDHIVATVIMSWVSVKWCILHFSPTVTSIFPSGLHPSPPNSNLSLWAASICPSRFHKIISFHYWWGWEMNARFSYSLYLICVI